MVTIIFDYGCLYFITKAKTAIRLICIRFYELAEVRYFPLQLSELVY